MNLLAYGLPDACRQLGNIGRTKLYALLQSGELKAIKVGRRTVITHQALHDYLNTRPCLRLNRQAAKSQNGGEV
jgi:excisionase family DNA binding protein